MFEGKQFYFSTTRKIVAVFGTLFNSLYIGRYSDTGTLVKNISVPLVYAPKRHFIARQAEEDSERVNTNVAITLPRMSFELVDMQYDATRSINPRRSKKYNSTNVDNMLRQQSPAPYTMMMDLNVYTKNTDDMFQILEQILPYFRPSITVPIKLVTETNQIVDVPFKLTGVSPSIEYEGSLGDGRTLIYTLSFDIETYIYPPVEDTGIIKKVYANSITNDDNRVDVEQLIEVDPITAQIDDVWLAKETITEF